MNAMLRERPMIEDHRMIKLEADVEHLRTDMSEAKQDIRELQVSVSGLRTEFHEFRLEVTKDFGSVRAEMVARFGAVDTQIESLRKEVATRSGDMNTRLEELRTETATRFGAVDTRIEALRTEMATRFGKTDVQLEALKTLIERNTRLMMVGGLSVMATVIAMFGTIGHALKWF